MKAYTNIDQSKILAEILPLESADMAYYFMKDSGHPVNLSPFVLDGTEVKENGMFTYLNCWSLAALLEIIPKYIEGSNRLRIDIDNVNFSIWYDDLNDCGVNNKLPDLTLKEPVDACVEMILKLHERNLL